MSDQPAAGTSELRSLTDVLERVNFAGARSRRSFAGQGTTGLLGVLGLASAALYAVGYMPAEPAAALLLVGWVAATRLHVSTSRVFAAGTNHLGTVALRTLDAAILLGVGLVFILREGWPQTVMVWAVADALTGYLSYYSQVAVLKSVPAGMRTGEPGTMAAVDHLFLSSPLLWGPDRELVAGLCAVGLLTGLPEWGLAAAVFAGNLNWILKFRRLWREVNRK
ncbi:MAG: hypothetical protein JXQ83_09490 [Candidatus Glassbacteria bacterium]|nr:hypothetical protein [Candidatus Glassbacteria bacterium]